MVALLTTVHVLVAVILILVVLLQSARGTDLAGAFGGMGSQAAFGPRGTATFLSKATIVLAVIFMVTSLTLAILSNRLQAGGESVLSGQEAAAPPSQPTAPPPNPAAPTPAAPGAPGVQVQTEGELPGGAKVAVEPLPPTAPSAPAAPAQMAPPPPTTGTGSPPTAPGPSP